MMKAMAATATAAAVAGTGVSTATADEEDPEDMEEALHVMGSEIRQDVAAWQTALTGEEPEWADGFMDEDDAEDALADYLQDDIYSSATEMMNWTDLFLTSIENQLVMLSDFIRNNVQYRVVAEAQDGKTHEEVEAAAVEEAEESISQIEQNFLQTWTELMHQVSQRAYVVEEVNDDIDAEDLILALGYDEDGNAFQETIGSDNSIGLWWGNVADLYTDNFNAEGGLEEDDGSSNAVVEYPLADGETVLVPVTNRGDHNGNETWVAPWASWPDNDPPSLDSDWDDETIEQPLSTIRSWDGAGRGNPITKQFNAESRVDTGDGATNSVLVDCEEWMEVHEDIITLREEEPAYAEDITETLYEPASEGEITVEEVSGASAILDVADTEEWEDANEAAAVYRSVGMPEGEQSAVIESAGSEYEGVLFWTQPGGEYLTVGEEIDPSERDGSFYLAAEVNNATEPEDLAYPVEFAVRDGDDDPVEDATVRVYDDSGDVLADEEDPEDGEASLDVQGGSNREFVVQWTDSEGDLEEASETQNLSGGVEVVVETDSQSMEIFTQEEYISAADETEGDILANELAAPFTITGVDGGGDELTFPERELIEPDASQEEMIERLQQAYEAEQESQEELQVTISDDTGGGSGFVDDDDDWIVWLAGLFGVGLIVTILLSAVNSLNGFLPDEVNINGGGER
ncbi:hypothetical protein Natoc_2293 [Natronococcus occultus SP4]|uniref:Envelope protein N-terminal domain-containing protein n=2 Tax=Natronococcus occultus TaxID=29288 RepID=L0JZ83_9EURY|nr:hypothetical protein Natoc_2293 [Natronococcus occultus SP4]